MHTNIDLDESLVSEAMRLTKTKRDLYEGLSELLWKLTVWDLNRASDSILNMKTIAITIDDATLKVMDELTKTSPQLRSRSALVRTALREYVAREQRRRVEAKDGELFRKHRKRLARQAHALVSEQAD